MEQEKEKRQVTDEVLGRLQNMNDKDLFVKAVGMTVEEFAETYPDQATQFAYGTSCTDRIVSRGFSQGTMYLASRIKADENGNRVIDSFQFKGQCLEKDVFKKRPVAGKEKLGFNYFGKFICKDEVVDRLLERGKWLSKDGKDVYGRLNSNSGGYYDITRADGSKDQVIFGIAPNGDVVGDSKNFVLAKFFDDEGNVRNRQAYGHVFTAEEALKLVEGGEVIIDGSRENGETFKVCVAYAPGNPNNDVIQVHPSWYEKALQAGVVDESKVVESTQKKLDRIAEKIAAQREAAQKAEQKKTEQKKAEQKTEQKPKRSRSKSV